MFLLYDPAAKGLYRSLGNEDIGKLLVVVLRDPWCVASVS